MNYVYSEKYGDRFDQAAHRKRLKDRHGDDIPWQSDHDTAVDKGLLQIMKEDKMPFARLIAVLRAETVKAMHSRDRWRQPAYEQLHKYTGHRDAAHGERADYTMLHTHLAQYWHRLTEDIKQSRATQQCAE